MARKTTTKNNDYKFRRDEIDLIKHATDLKDETYATVGYRMRRDDDSLDKLDSMAFDNGISRAFLVRRMVMHCLQLWEDNKKRKKATND